MIRIRRGLLFIIRLIVGGLFIFSGLIKVNDPIGTSIKLEEYFDVFSYDIAPFFEAFKAVSLPLAVFLVVMEVTLGVMVIVGWKIKTAVNLLLAMIILFTFLTFYSAYFDKVTDCGCFGDAIVLTPWESFFKDIFLLALIAILFFFKKDLPHNPFPWAKMVVLGSFALSLILSVTAINNLPFIDFRAYKEGVNIEEAMQPSAPLEYSYLMKKGDEIIEFDQYPSEDTYEFVEMNLRNPEALPKISDFTVWNAEGDFTQQILSGKKLLILTSNIQKMSAKNLDRISALVHEMENSEIEAVLVGASSEEESRILTESLGWNIRYYMADATVVKTIVRSNPGLVVMSEGKIVRKYHHNNTPNFSEVQELFFERK